MDTRNATISEMIHGYRQDPETGEYVCLTCGKRFPRSAVYMADDRLFDARAAVTRHVEQHGDRLDALLAEDKKLSETQRTLIRLMYAGKPDAEIAEALGIKPSTVRQQRFQFREKARTARRYLAMYELAFGQPEEAAEAPASTPLSGVLIREASLQGTATPPVQPDPASAGADAEKSDLPEVHVGATQVDDRYFIEPKEEQRILGNMFSSQNPLQLKKLSSKEKKKVVTLRRIAKEFQPGRLYSENEVDDILKAIYPEDHVILRRYLIEYGFLDRERDCSGYWVSADGKPVQPK